MTNNPYLSLDLELCSLYFQLGMDPSFMIPFPLTQEQYDQVKKEYEKSKEY